MSDLGDRIRARRTALAALDPQFGLRRLAVRAGISPTYLSRLETGKADPPSAAVIEKLAFELGENPDVLCALADRTSPRLKRIINQHPELFGQLLDQLDDLPKDALLRVVREVRDGDW